jgi:hypothetical protein
MDRRRQPAMHVGTGAARRGRDDHDDRHDHDDEWSDPSALTRGWALTRLVLLVVAVGLGAGIAIGIALWLTLTALESAV